MKAAWNAIVSQLSSLIKESRPASTWPFSTPLSLTSPTKRASTSSTSSSSVKADSTKNVPRYYLAAVTPTGPGAAPLPDWVEVLNAALFNNQAPPPLPWTKIHVTDELCDHKIPLSVVKTHQVLVVKRGGCDFSNKLQNIPAYTPRADALQVVLVVSYGVHRDAAEAEAAEDHDSDETELIRPYLERQQITPAGLPRRNPIPMLLVGGGKRVYDALKDGSVGVGIKRRYHVETKGVRIANLVVV